MRFKLAEKAPLIIVKARVNSEGPFGFLVDTGSSVTVITKKAIEAIGLQEKLDTEKGSVSCCSSASVSVGSIQVDDVEAKNIPMIPGNLLTISEEIGTHIDGIIGSTMLKNYKVTIDYPEQEIFFEQPSKRGETKMKFKSGERTHFVVVETMVNGRGPFDFLVDTGASITTITKHAGKTLGLHEKAWGQRRAFSGSFAGMVMTLAKAEIIQVGDAKVKDIDVGLHDLTSLSNMIETPVDGVIGYNFMKDYRIAINYPHQEVFFERVDRNDSEVSNT